MTTKTIVKDILALHSLPDAELKKFETGTNEVFLYGEDYVIKILDPLYPEEQMIESTVLNHLQNKLNIRVPHLHHSGIFQDVPYIIMSYVEGELLENQWEHLSFPHKKEVMKDIGTTIATMHAISVDGLPVFYMEWDRFMNKQVKDCMERHKKNGLKASLVKEIPTYIANHIHLLPSEFKSVLLTGEYTPFNLLVTKKNTSWSLSGMIDFADCMIGYHKYDLLGPAVFLAAGNRELQRALFLSYGLTQDSLNPTLKKELTLLLLLHRYSNLGAQIRMKDWEKQVNSLKDLEDLVWNF